MGVSDLKFDTNAGPVVDLSARGLQRLDPGFTCSEDTHTLILDRNHIMKLDHLERSPSLQQLSVANNRLVRMMGVSRLTQLRVLNLPNNSIGYIEGLRDLPQLTWLNLSGNNIKVMEQLNSCVSLVHLDLSDNNVSALGDVTKLKALKTLLLHGNSITSLRTLSSLLPTRLSVLSLAENEITDLNEVSYVSPLHDLEQLSIMSNPCVLATPTLPAFDYRPYIMSWCLNLKVLDGYVASQKEGLKAEWLYSQGKGRSYRPGQHVELVQYLATVCPLTSSPALETAEDAKLERILNKQRLHQKQLLDEARANCTAPPRPTELEVETHAPPDGALRVGVTDTAAGPVTASSGPQTEPVVQVNTWVGCDSSRPAMPSVRGGRTREELVRLEDVQTEEEKLQDLLLSPESTFVPSQSDPEPRTVQSDSEDETDTFEPDSLAPPKKPHSPARAEKQEASSTLHVGPDASAASPSPGRGVSSPRDDPETSTDLREARMKETEQVEKVEAARVCGAKVDLEKAAVKIQSWWRGHFTRRCHPEAREVRGEIRLRRMQDHILFLYQKLDSLQRRCEEERLQRRVQDEAVKFLWKELQSMQQWKSSVEQQLTHIAQAATPAQVGPAGPFRASSPPVASSTSNPPGADVSFPDSGFPSTCSQQQAALEDSFLSSGTEDSLGTVRALSPGGAGSPDCSLLEQYLSSLQQMEQEAEEAGGVGAVTPRLPSPAPPDQTAQPGSHPQTAAAQRTEGGALSPVACTQH